MTDETTPTRTNRAENEAQMRALLEALLEISKDDDHDEDFLGSPIKRVTSFEEAGILTRNEGLVVRLEDGRVFHVEIREDRRER